ncbi:MAG: hypothetical protein MMC23_009527, partial [Stictis urceolatum]|nr:hypothetical protein [Stictis urceolata]
MDESFPREEEEEGDSETDRMSKSFGVLHFQNNKAMYIGDAHWAAILNDVSCTMRTSIRFVGANCEQISEVKTYFNEHKKQYDDQIKKISDTKKTTGRALTGAPAFLLGGGKNLPQFSDLTASLPGRDAVDKMVARYFNDYDPSTHILHPPSWRRQYDNHWHNPGETDPAFVGQLFAICGLAMQSFHKAGDEPYEYRNRTLSLAANYRSLTQQCLLLADYSKPSSAILETMVLHLHGEYSKNGEAELGIWVLVGMIVRLAMRMGLHRDSKHYSNITPFQGEMRRRIWTFVRQADLLFSFQMGLPSMIRSDDCDTELPRNLFDEDFDEESTILPPSRPNSDWTPVSYMVAKSIITFVFGKIVEATHAVHAAPYEDIMKLDNELHDAYHSLPSLLHQKTAEESSLEPVNTIMMRFHVSALYNKGVCVLHRKYLSRARENSKYAHSRRACIDASMALLRMQVTLHAESQPGRRMQNMKWYTNSLTIFDFLLAATLVCLDLFYSAQAESMGRASGDVEMWGSCRREEMIQAIVTSRSIWEEIKDSYMEAYKAYSILGVMLNKVHVMRTQTAAKIAQRTFQYSGNNKPTQQYSPPEDEKPEHSAAITLGMLSSGGLTPGSTTAFNGGPYPPTPGSNNANMQDAPASGMTPNFMSAEQLAMNANSPFSSFFANGPGVENPSNLDWAAWDSYIQNPAGEVANMWGGVDIPPTGQEPEQPQLN